MILPMAVVLFSCSCVISGDIDTIPLDTDEAHAVLRRAAEKAQGQEALLSSDPPKTNKTTNFFEIREDTTKEIVARLQLSQGAFLANLVKIKKEASGVYKFVMDGRRVMSYGTYTFNKTEPTISATKVVKNTKDGNSTKIDVTFSYKEQAQTNGSELQVNTAEFKFTIEWGWLSNVTRGDYWNLTSAGLKLTGMIGDQNLTELSADLTPKFSYTGKAGDTACTTGYGSCAPLYLSWACGNQTLAPTNLKAVGDGNYTLQWIMPGLELEPEWGDKANVNQTKFKFSDPWDCDPLLPLPVWVGLLISLFLASILLWAIQMLTALQTPNKWDDPKKPGIQVAQSE